MYKGTIFDCYDEMPEGENAYLTPREVMNILCIGKNTFYKLVNSGELPAFRIGSLWRVRKEDLDAFCTQKIYIKV